MVAQGPEFSGEMDVDAFRSGFTREVEARWSRPRPVVAGGRVSAYDAAPRVRSVRAVCLGADGKPFKADGVPAMDVSVSYPHLAYWGFANVPNGRSFEVPYSEACEVRASADCEFSWVEYELPDGSRRRAEGVRVTCSGSSLYRQPADSRGLGSGSRKFLFWPYKDVR